MRKCKMKGHQAAHTYYMRPPVLSRLAPLTPGFLPGFLPGYETLERVMSSTY